MPFHLLIIARVKKILKIGIKIAEKSKETREK